MGAQGQSALVSVTVVLAGAAVGALLRVALERAVLGPRGLVSWVNESGPGLLIGAVMALVTVPVTGESDGVASGLGGALVAYAAVCAAYTFVRARWLSTTALAPALARFAAAIASTGLGFVGVSEIWAALQ